MTEDALIGKQLGEYRLEALLAQGGMARVYRAMDVRLKRYVVVKVIDPPFHNDPDYIVRFEREAQAIARLDHPNIVRLYRFDEEDDWLYMAMQHVDGADLGSVLAGYRADKEFMEPDDIRRIIAEIGSALDYAHQKGIIHRDVKPANILLDRQGRAFLTDFGLALLVEVGTRGEIFGSPHYIAPEQAMSSAKAVPQSDLYSIGVILFEMFTGDVPFNASEPLDIALLHMSEEPPAPRQLRPDINSEVETVILKALAKNPADRYATCSDLVEALNISLRARSAASLLAKRATAPRQTIPERVALNLDSQSLPPIPAGVTPAPPPAVESSVSSGPVVPPAIRRPLTLTGAMIGLGLLLSALVCLALFFGSSLMNRFGQRGNLPGGQDVISSAAPAEFNGTAPGPQLQVTGPFTPSPEPASSVLTPTETLVSYELLIVRGRDENSLIVVNMSENAFPLSLLRLANGRDTLSGSAWNVDNLAGGACVGAWKGGEDRQAPLGVNCQLVGDRLQRNKKDLFGGTAFIVYYDGQEAGRCDKDQAQCVISFSP